MLLGDAKTLIWQYIDDEDQARWSATEIERALRTAINQVMIEGASHGIAGFISTSALLTGSATGAYSLSSLNALKVVSIVQAQGSARYKLKAMNPNPGNFNLVSDASRIYLEVRYIPAASFPANDAATITYGDNTSLEYVDLLDDLVCLKAAKSLGIKRGSLNGALEQRHAELAQTFRDIPNNPSMYIIPYSDSYPQANAGFYWFMRDNQTVQLATLNWF